MKKLLFLPMVLICLIAVQPVFAKDEIRYSKFNIHTQFKGGKDYRASYANYTNPGNAHVIIPAGTEMVITKKTRKSFVFECDNGTKRVLFEFHKKRMGMSLDDYLDKISSPEPTSLAGLSGLDQKGVTEGKALKGMSKKGVMAALGYPAAHRTPSPDHSTWIYWTNRFGTIAVDFDANGKVVGIKD